MISVCIPVFNVDVRKLAEILFKQAADLSAEGIPVEIIFLDDGSRKEYRELNRELNTLDVESGGTPIYKELEENIGRSAIRNRFIEEASHPNLLFMDCDSAIPSDNYLQVYTEAIRQYPDQVVCGGRIYPKEPPERKRRLHWKYGIRRESKAAGTRKKDPNRSFMTNNFIVPLSLLKEILFDERLSGYGHEDSLFGYELTKRGKEIIHIENPVVHEGLETNREFLNKTAQAVRNLVHITNLNDIDQGFKESIKLIRTAERLKSRGLAGPVRAVSIICNPLIQWILQNGCTSLNLLDAYKLGLFLRTKKNRPDKQGG